MYKQQTVSLVFPAYNEAENIAEAISEFKRLDIFDEIIVIDNNSRDKTSQLAKKTGVRVVKEKKQGYGYAVRKGLSVAKKQLIVLVEPDGTFKAQDAKRLLHKLASVGCVLGTRTHPSYIQPKANMGLVMRWGNIALAKLIQVLFQTPTLSDGGCTFRAMSREVRDAVVPRLTVGGSYLLPEMTIVIHQLGFSLLEIPVYYRPRVGTSKITGSKIRAAGVGRDMVLLVLSRWWNSVAARPNTHLQS